MKHKAVICDLDGTLFNCDHRRHFVEREKKDWNSFLSEEELAKDPVNEWCNALIKALYGAGFIIIYVSGRYEERRELTRRMLIDTYHLNIISSLFMRKNGDSRQDYIIKKEIYLEKIEPFYDVIFCIDDRKQVVEMWRDLGLTCLHCAEGDF